MTGESGKKKRGRPRNKWLEAVPVVLRGLQKNKLEGSGKEHGSMETSGTAEERPPMKKNRDTKS